MWTWAFNMSLILAGPVRRTRKKLQAQIACFHVMPARAAGFGGANFGVSTGGAYPRRAFLMRTSEYPSSECRKAQTLPSGQLYLHTRTAINSALVNSESCVSVWRSCHAIKFSWPGTCGYDIVSIHKNYCSQMVHATDSPSAICYFGGSPRRLCDLQGDGGPAGSALLPRFGRSSPRVPLGHMGCRLERKKE